MRELLKRSPDRADALCLTFAPGGLFAGIGLIVIRSYAVTDSIIEQIKGRNRVSLANQHISTNTRGAAYPEADLLPP